MVNIDDGDFKFVYLEYLSIMDNHIFFYFKQSFKTASYLILIVDIIKLCISSGNGSINAKGKRFYYRLNSIQFKRYDTLSEMECRS